MPLSYGLGLFTRSSSRTADGGVYRCWRRRRRLARGVIVGWHAPAASERHGQCGETLPGARIGHVGDLRRGLARCSPQHRPVQFDRADVDVDDARQVVAVRMRVRPPAPHARRTRLGPRGHAVYCRRDVARVMMALRVEFSGQDHPVGREIKRISEALVKHCARLINVGRRDGSLPPGPPAGAVALAFWGALEGAVIALAGQAPHDELLATRAVAGVLGLDSPPAPHPVVGERR